jgi:hypothetical protein
MSIILIVLLITEGLYRQGRSRNDKIFIVVIIVFTLIKAMIILRKSKKQK